jgi:hypothetical protein
VAISLSEMRAFIGHAAIIREQIRTVENSN